jgi:hypothetical protein
MTTTTTIEVLQKAAELGLKLGVEPPDTLTLQPAGLCSAEFAEVLKAHKPALLALLKLPFVMVFSKTVGETIFFCEDEDTRGVLAEAGAEPGSIYTREELSVLVEQHRRAPITAGDLLRIHRAKRMFDARLAG